MKKTHFLLVAALTLLCLPQPRANEPQVWVVGGKNSDLSALEAKAVRSAFLGNPTSVLGGRELKAIDRRDSSAALRAFFYESVVEKRMSQMKAHWSQLIFTGRGYPPPLVTNLEELKTLLNSTPGGISFIEPSEAGPDFKVLLKIPAN